jgi:hypothetical protein
MFFKNVFHQDGGDRCRAPGQRIPNALVWEWNWVEKTEGCQNWSRWYQGWSQHHDSLINAPLLLLAMPCLAYSFHKFRAYSNSGNKLGSTQISIHHVEGWSWRPIPAPFSPQLSLDIGLCLYSGQTMASLCLCFFSFYSWSLCIYHSMWSFWMISNTWSQVSSKMEN